MKKIIKTSDAIGFLFLIISYYILTLVLKVAPELSAVISLVLGLLLSDLIKE